MAKFVVFTICTSPFNTPLKARLSLNSTYGILQVKIKFRLKFFFVTFEVII